MYLSRLYIRNYRSIKELDLRFEKGKNVIIGRNNAGKSNIIKALNIVLIPYPLHNYKKWLYYLQSLQTGGKHKPHLC